MEFTMWYLVGGLLLISLAVGDSILRRMPVTVTMLYLLVGVALGPVGAGMISLSSVRDAGLVERAAEAVVIVSLFAAGLKMRVPLRDRRWVLPVLLATVSMALTVGMIALAGVFALGLPLGGAVLLGAILAPTDPVLASDVQVENPADSDRLRFGLTGEAGLNDGTAFPFVMLGLGLLGLHEIGSTGLTWFVADVVWAIGGGVATGALLGTGVGYLVVSLRRRHKEALGLDDFLALGLIAVSYGLAIAIGTYGFLSVFAAGLALRRIERRHSGGEDPPPQVKLAAAEEESHEISDPEGAPAYMAQAVLGFSEQLERIGTLAVVLLLGAMLLANTFPPDILWFVPLLFLVIRPLAVLPVLPWVRLDRTQKRLVAWFGIRGIGSVYYLAFAVANGAPTDIVRVIVPMTLWSVAISVFIHGFTGRPLMRVYARGSDTGRVVTEEGTRSRSRWGWR